MKKTILLLLLGVLCSIGNAWGATVFTFPTSKPANFTKQYSLSISKTGDANVINGEKIYYESYSPSNVSSICGVEANYLGVTFKPSKDCFLEIEAGNENSSSGSISLTIYKLKDSRLYQLYCDAEGSDMAQYVLDNASETDISFWKDNSVLKKSGSSYVVDGSNAGKVLSGQTNKTALHEQLNTQTFTVNGKASNPTTGQVKDGTADTTIVFKAGEEYTIYAHRSSSKIGFKKFTFTPVYQLTWGLDGGSITSEPGTYSAAGYYPAGEALTAPTVEKDGSDFVAWSPSVTTMPSANTTYTATWSVSSTYDATFSSSKGEAPSNTNASSVTLTEITGVDNFKNTGWVADKTVKVGGVNKTAGTVLAIDDVVTLLENTTFTAQWAATHTITYTNLKGSNVSSYPTYYIEGVGVASFEDLADVAGYSFTGWSPSSISYSATTNQTIEATWEEATYTVTIAKNENSYGTISATSVSSVAYNTTISASDATATLSVGATDITAIPAASTAEYTYAFSNWSGVPAGGKVVEDVTVTANFTRTANNYTLAWNTNGGSDLAGDPTSGTVAYGTTITKPTNPTRSGYVFIGWAESKEGDIVNVPSTMPASNKTYYAIWGQKIQWAMSFSNSGSTIPAATPTPSAQLTNLTSVAKTDGIEYTESSGKSDASPKITDFANEAGANGKYIYVTFDVAEGYIFLPLKATISTTAVTNAKTIKVSIGSNSQTWAQPASGSSTPTAHDYLFTSPLACSGTVTVKIQAYGDSNTKGFRLGSPIVIYGKVIPTSVSASFSADWATFASIYPLDLNLTDGITGGLAYAAKEITTVGGHDQVVLTPCTGVVPANTGLMIKKVGSATSFTIATSTAAASAPESNLLEGAAEGASLGASDNAFILANTSGLGFYKVVSDITLAAGKAYLVYDGDITPAPSGIRIVVEENTTTAVEAIEATEKAVKFFENGQLFIKKNGITYDVTGRVVR